MYCPSFSMRISRERKIYAVLIGAAAVGLGAVFFSSGPGAKVTEAAAAAVDPENKPVAKGSTEPADRGTDSPSLASKLKSFETSHKIDIPADAFKPSSIWAATKPKVEAFIASAQAADAFKGTHQLSAVLVAGTRSEAIIDGRTVALGQTVDGYKLAAVTPKTAMFVSGGNKVLLRVPVSEQIAAVEVR
jgi:hypothetical protein